MNYNHILFIIFSLVVVIFLLWNSTPRLIENLDNQSQDGNSKSNCCGNDPLFLAMKNSSEISILKDQVKEINDLKQKVNVLETNTQNNTKYIEDLQQQYLNEATDVQSAMDTPDEMEVQPEISETSLSPQEQLEIQE